MHTKKMYIREKISREDRFQQEKKNPSFSSTLLAEIYRTIDEGNPRQEKLTLYRESTLKKQSSYNVRSNRVFEEEEEENASFKRASLIEKWMEKKVNEKLELKKKQFSPEMERRVHYDNDPLFFSSSSISSDSSSGEFSSSGSESIQEMTRRVSCFPPPHQKPLRSSGVSYRSKKSSTKAEETLFYDQRKLHTFNDQQYNSETGHEEGLIKSKSRALKMYANLKKVKQPISPGGKLTNFLNSLFTTGHAKKTKNVSPANGGLEERITEKKLNLASESTCSSASSFTRSCLSKTSPSTREKLRNGVKRSVRFYPVSVIVDEDCRPCGHKCLDKEDSSPVSLRDAINLTTRSVEELKIQSIGKSRQAEETAASRDYLRNQKKNDLILSDNYEFDEDDDDDAASDASSDLFEIDHLAFLGKNNGRYCEELPVYETTHVHTNRAIANGLIL